MPSLRELYAAATNWPDRQKFHADILKNKRAERIVVLIAGHHRAGVQDSWPFWHNRDPGALCPFDSETNEHYECEKLVAQAAAILKKDGFAVVVLPFDLSLTQKTKYINENFCSEDLLLSVHLNSYPYDQRVGGTETFIVPGNAEVARNAEVVQNILVKTLGLPDRGVKPDLQTHNGWLGILRDTVIVEDYLLELGFITCEKDLDRVREVGPQAIADAAKAGFYW